MLFSVRSFNKLSDNLPIIPISNLESSLSNIRNNTHRDRNLEFPNVIVTDLRIIIARDAELNTNCNITHISAADVFEELIDTLFEKSVYVRLHLSRQDFG